MTLWNRDRVDQVAQLFKKIAALKTAEKVSVCNPYTTAGNRTWYEQPTRVSYYPLAHLSDIEKGLLIDKWEEELRQLGAAPEGTR